MALTVLTCCTVSNVGICRAGSETQMSTFLTNRTFGKWYVYNVIFEERSSWYSFGRWVWNLRQLNRTGNCQSSDLSKCLDRSAEMQKHCAVFLFTYSAFGPGFLAGTLIENHFKSKASNYLSYRPWTYLLSSAHWFYCPRLKLEKRKNKLLIRSCLRGGSFREHAAGSWWLLISSASLINSSAHCCNTVRLHSVVWFIIHDTVGWFFFLDIYIPASFMKTPFPIAAMNTRKQKKVNPHGAEIFK